MRNRHGLRVVTAPLTAQSPAAAALDVGIIGGGPAGLATAVALLKVRPDLRLRVFEKADFGPKGAAVLVAVNGLNAVEAIDPQLYQTLERCAIKLKESILHDPHTGAEVDRRPMPSDLISKVGKCPLLLGWHDIVRTLHDALPSGAVLHGYEFSHYEQEADGTLRVCGSTSRNAAADAAQIASCKVLIGADGWFSRVRQQCLNDGPPKFRDAVVWRARIPRPVNFPEDTTFWFRSGRFGQFSGTAIDLAVLIPIPGGQLVWQCHATPALLQRQGLTFDPIKGSPTESAHVSSDDDARAPGVSQRPRHMAKARCLTAFNGWARAFLDVVESTPAEAITEHGLYQRTADMIPDTHWGVGGVTLVGDSAHTAFVDGTGMNLALEDAAVLGWHVQQRGLSPETLRAFEAERIPRVKRIFSVPGSQEGLSPEEREELLLKFKFQPLHR